MMAPPAGKAADALRTIGEVVAETGVAAHILRYWERQVRALQPLRRAGDRRYYRAEDVRLISEIARLINEEGYTLEGAARAATQRSRRAGEPMAGTAPAIAVPARAMPAMGQDARDGAQGTLFPARAGSGSPDGAISLVRLRQMRERLRSALERDETGTPRERH